MAVLLWRIAEGRTSMETRFGNGTDGGERREKVEQRCHVRVLICRRMMTFFDGS